MRLHPEFDSLYTYKDTLRNCMSLHPTPHTLYAYRRSWENCISPPIILRALRVFGVRESLLNSGVLQRVAVVAVCCSVLQCAVVCCSVLQRVAVCCSGLQCVAVYCSVFQCVAV